MLLQLSQDDVAAPLCLPLLIPICNALEMHLSVCTTRAFPRRKGQGMENLPDFFGLRWSILNSIAPLNHSRLKSTEDFAPEKQGFIMILFSSRCCEKLINLGILMLIGKEISSLEGVVEHRLFLDMATAANIAGNTSLDVKTK
ncbi:hypothetical protein NL676_030961 [Syzygium grande]|nr:hypothetical protein NL676_030961 [Syzygium grande]